MDGRGAERSRRSGRLSPRGSWHVSASPGEGTDALARCRQRGGSPRRLRWPAAPSDPGAPPPGPASRCAARAGGGTRGRSDVVAMQGSGQSSSKGDTAEGTGSWMRPKRRTSASPFRGLTAPHVLTGLPLPTGALGRHRRPLRGPAELGRSRTGRCHAPLLQSPSSRSSSNGLGARPRGRSPRGRAPWGWGQRPEPRVGRQRQPR